MSKHIWLNEYFNPFGEWCGYKTCLQTYKCKICRKELTIPENSEIEDDSPCIKREHPNQKPLQTKHRREKQRERR